MCGSAAFFVLNLIFLASIWREDVGETEFSFSSFFPIFFFLFSIETFNGEDFPKIFFTVKQKKIFYGKTSKDLLRGSKLYSCSRPGRKLFTLKSSARYPPPQQNCLWFSFSNFFMSFVFLFPHTINIFFLHFKRGKFSSIIFSSTFLVFKTNHINIFF